MKRIAALLSTVSNESAAQCSFLQRVNRGFAQCGSLGALRHFAPKIDGEARPENRAKKNGMLFNPTAIVEAETSRDLLRIFEATTTVFPESPAPTEALEHYHATRRAIDEVESEWLNLQPRTVSEIPRLCVKRYRVYCRAVDLFEKELQVSRKQKRAAMALSHDWSGMGAYWTEGLAIWKCRVMLWSACVLFRIGFPGAQDFCNARGYDMAAALPVTPCLTKEPEVLGGSQLRSSLALRRVAVVTEKPGRVIRTGSLALDVALGIGGFPRGKIVEIFGKESTGKTTLALASAVNVQREGGVVAFLDAEYKLIFPWARALGLDIDKMLVLQGVKAKDTLDSLLDVVASGRFALVVVDTLAALVPDENIEASHGAFNGEMGQLFARALPRLASAGSRTETCILLLNQIRHNHQEMFGESKLSPGGHAVHHYSSIRLELHKHLSFKREDKLVGMRTKAIVTKNCLGPPRSAAEWVINFERGIDQDLELIEQGIAQGVITRQSPTVLNFGQQVLGGDDAARDFLFHHRDTAIALDLRLRAKMMR